MPNLRVTELDFDDIKANLKTFLESQSEFTDYDFEGSSLSVLLDILAYNTHYNAYLANMLTNEMFLDSAVKRSSLVSIAKHLGYTPNSVTGSRAVIDVAVSSVADNPATLTLNRYSPFSTSINGTTYTFYNLNAITATPSGGTYTFDDVTVVQGTLLSKSYTVSTPGPDEKYEIPNEAVDTSTLRVTVQNSVSDTTVNTYTLATDITGLDSTSEKYFLEENTVGNFQLYFGDGVVGKKLTAGNIITIQYLASAGDVTNVSTNFTQSFTSSTIGGSDSIVVTTVSNSTSGAPKETIASIRYNAPKANAAKNRAVTTDDFKTLIQNNYTGAESISVWGGEENNPPKYGKVIISLKPFDGFTISNATKTNIKNTILADRKVLAIQPEFIDPEYIRIGLNIGVTFNTNLTNLSAEQVSNTVNTTVNNYFTNDLQKFNSNFYHSKLIKNIVDSDTSIIGAIATVTAQIRKNLVLGVANSFSGDSALQYNNRINPGEFKSTRFFISESGTSTLVNITDLPDTRPANQDGTGTLRLINAVTNVVINANIGTINYRTGEVNITDFTPIGFPSGISDIRFNAPIQEESYNLASERNIIFVLDDSTRNATTGLAGGLTITMTAVAE